MISDADIDLEAIVRCQKYGNPGTDDFVATVKLARSKVHAAKPDPRRRRSSVIAMQLGADTARKLGPWRLEVTMMKAVGLAAVDRGGTSDPYVKLRLEHRASKKTTVQYKTLNPVWDETISWKLRSLETQLDFDVWDRNEIGHDTFLGEVRLGKLDDLLLQMKVDLSRFADDGGTIPMPLIGELANRAGMSHRYATITNMLQLTPICCHNQCVTRNSLITHISYAITNVP